MVHFPHSATLALVLTGALTNCAGGATLLDSSRSPAAAPVSTAPEFAPVATSSAASASLVTPVDPPDAALSSGELRLAADRAGVLFGASVGMARLDEPPYREVVPRDFNYLTPENEMKWELTEPRRGEFAFTAADRVLLFAKSHGMKVKGHPLVWHQRLPGWTQTLLGSDAAGALKRHIRETVSHFKGYVVAWDVVNEALDDAPGHLLRNDVWRAQIGDKYVEQAFVAAHEADPDALLFYNDYGIESIRPGSKGEAMLALVTRLVKAGVPISGVGFQAHLQAHGDPSAAEIADALQRVTALGLVVNISELDVNVCAVSGSTEDKLRAQATRYHDVVAACYALGAKCHGVTVWGVTDKYSWLNDLVPCSPPQTGKPWPVLLDERYQPKPAFQAVLNAIEKR